MEQALDLLLFAYRDIVSIKLIPRLVLIQTCYHYLKEVALYSTYERLSNQMESILQARALYSVT